MKVSSSIKLFSVGLIGMAYTSIANAESPAAKVEIRGALVSADNAIVEVEGVEADDTMNIVPERAKIQWKGAVHNNVDMRARLDILKLNHGGVSTDGTMTTETKSPVEYMYFDWKVMNGLTVRFGQDKVVQKGYDMNWGIADTYRPVYSGALSAYAPVVAFRYAFMGTAMLQLLNDQGKSYNMTENGNMGRQPTFNLEWRGKMMNGQVMPLVQYSTFDNQKSSIIAFGAKYVAMGVDAYFSYTMESIASKGVDSDGDSENQASSNSSLSIRAAYAAGDFEPFFYYNMFNNEQYTADGADQPTANPALGTFDDNGTAMHLGLRLKHDKNVTPFVEYATKSGTYNDPANAGDEISLSGSTMKVGFWASM